MFFGRWGLVEKVIDGLTQGYLASSVIYGGRRSGKTSLMRMIERKLNERLASEDLPIVVPLYMDLQIDPPESPAQFFGRLIKCLGAWYLDLGDKVNQKPDVFLPMDHTSPATSFANAFINIFNQTQPVIGGVRLAILVDESENLNRPDWARELEENLRALLSNVPGVSGHLGLVMTGGVDFYWNMANSKGGSPLRNVLDEEILLPPCPQAEMQQLASVPTQNQISEAVVEEIVTQAGGQLFLGQYLLHHIWKKGFENTDTDFVKETAVKFFDTRRDYEGWSKALGHTGQKIFVYLARQDNALSYQEISKALNISRLDAKKYLDVLTFHNLVDKRDNKYFSRGRMSEDWFVNNLDETTDEDSPENNRGNVTNIYIGGDVKDSNIIAGDHDIVKDS
jgi:hypothetical protein